MTRSLSFPTVTLLAVFLLACTPSAPKEDAPSPAQPTADAPPPDQPPADAPLPPSAAPEVPAFVAALAENPLPGKWSLVRGQGVVLANFDPPGSPNALASVACLQQSQQVELMFAPPSRSPGRAPGDTRLLTLSVITSTEKLMLNAVDTSQSSGRHEVSARTEHVAADLQALAKPQERFALRTDYFGPDITLVFPWDQSIAEVLGECGA